MPRILVSPFACPLLAALACAPAETPRAEPASQPSTPAAPAPASPPVVTAEPAVPPPRPDAATEPAPSPTPAPVAPTEASRLRVVAVREGMIELSGWGTRLVPLLDGEPLAMSDGRPTRGAAGSRGVPPAAYLDPQYTYVDFGGPLDQPSGAWLTLSTEEERSTAVNLVYHRQGTAWEPVDLRRGLLRAYHAFYVERGGALLAYQRWAVDHEQALYDDGDGSPKAMRFQERVTRALEDVEPGFVQLAGAPVELPAMPDDAEPFSAVTAPDGTIYAVAGPNDYASPKLLLLWPPGATKAQRVALPGLTSLGHAELSLAGEWVLAHGNESNAAYLAIGKGSEWQQVSVEEADRGTKGYELNGAARAPDGTLWITFGNRWHEEGEEHPVWRKATDGAWQPVPLPAFDRAWFPSERQWGLRSGYGVEEGVLDEVPRSSTLEAAAAPFAVGLRWGDDAVWVSLDVGTAYADDALGMHPQSVLLTTAGVSGSEPPVVLPSAPTLRLERHNHAHRSDVPGAPTCQHPVLVLGPASLVDERPDAVKALAEHAPKSDTAPGIEHTYVGELDGARVLAGQARARTRKQAESLVEAIAKATGLTVTAGCRVPTVERVLE
jgi:hypothetical protein